MYNTIYESRQKYVTIEKYILKKHLPVIFTNDFTKKTSNFPK